MAVEIVLSLTTYFLPGAADVREFFRYNAAGSGGYCSCSMTRRHRRITPKMKKDWILTQELFDELLSWLNPDREQAGLDYEDLRRRLIKLFTCRRCHEPEDLADETINRVASKVAEIKEKYVGSRAPYFFAVANKVHMEKCRPKPLPEPPPAVEPSPATEAEHECLEWCMEQQTPENRKLVLEYYRGEKKAKIDHRKKLAEKYGIALNALRIRAHRIRAILLECVKDCLERREHEMG